MIDPVFGERVRRAGGGLEKPGGSLRSAAPCVLAAALLAMLGGCGHDAIQDLPESAFVEDAPWPRLADNPAPAPLQGENSVAVEVAEGEAIKAELGPEAEALISRDAELRDRNVVDPGLYARAERLRVRAARLRARAE